MTHAENPFLLIASVILPDHLHCIWRLPSGDYDNAGRWRQIKTYFSRAIPAVERLSERRQAKGERGIWQRRYWETVVRDEEHLRRCIDYLHRNPQKHGYVTRVVDWPHSSFHRYVRKGWLEWDWAGEVE